MLSQFGLGILFILVGAGITVFGFYSLRRTELFRAKGIAAEGTVYDFFTTRDYEERVNHFIAVGFLTLEQKLIVKNINVNMRPYEFKKGDPINIIYDPQEPDRILIDEERRPAYIYFTYFFPAALFGLIGIGMLFIK